jgi:hypothetical protein
MLNIKEEILPSMRLQGVHGRNAGNEYISFPYGAMGG